MFHMEGVMFYMLLYNIVTRWHTYSMFKLKAVLHTVLVACAIWHACDTR